MMLKIALGGVGSLALVVMLPIWHSPSPVAAAAPEQTSFDETWRDAAMPLAFRSALLTSTGPKVVQTVTVVPEVVALPDPPEGKAKRKLRLVELDACRGKGKRYHGRSWKCRR